MLDYHKFEEFSMKGHVHDHMVYATRFHIPTLTKGTVDITLNINMENGDYTILDYDDNFTLNNMYGNKMSLNYEFDENNTKNDFILLYWILTPREDGKLSDVEVNMNRVIANIDEETDISCNVTDENGNSIRKGTVDFEIRINE